MKSKLCVYCGEPANTQDHVPSRRIRRKLTIKVEYLLVPACWECNVQLLSRSETLTLEERKIEVKARLRWKYGRLLHQPEWTENDLNQLGPDLRQHIEHMIEAKARLERRLRY